MNFTPRSCAVVVGGRWSADKKREWEKKMQQHEEKLRREYYAEEEEAQKGRGGERREREAVDAVRLCTEPVLCAWIVLPAPLGVLF